MTYEMTPEEQELNAVSNEEMEERVQRAINAENMYVITAKGAVPHIVLLSRVGEVDTKMLITMEQARAVATELMKSADELDAYLVRRMILGE